jgi:hypothetical protein
MFSTAAGCYLKCFHIAYIVWMYFGLNVGVNSDQQCHIISDELLVCMPVCE